MRFKMIYTKANLEVVKVASRVAFDRGLNGVRLEPDGSTVAGNGKMMLAVGPCKAKGGLVERARAMLASIGDHGLVLTIEAVDKCLRYMTKGKSILGVAALVKVDDPARVGLMTMDERGDTTTGASLPKHDRFPDWRSIVRRVRGGGGTVRVCLNRTDLIRILEGMEAACPAKGGVNPVFIELGEGGRGAIVRGKNFDTGQHCLGVLMTYDTGGEWMPMDEWEMGVVNSPIPRRIK
jgi:hypothetical protein